MAFVAIIGVYEEVDAKNRAKVLIITKVCVFLQPNLDNWIVLTIH